MNTDVPAKRNINSQLLILSAAAFIVVFILWQISAWTNILYPIRLFVTFVHEAGHGLTAVATGGRFDSFQVFDNGAGLAYTSGGSRFLVPQMGYLGAALFGSVLLYAANRVQHVNVVATVVGLFFGACAIFFTGSGRTALFIAMIGTVGLWLLGDKFKRWSGVLHSLAALALVLTMILVRNELALVVGLVGGALLIALGLSASRPVTIFVLNMLAFLTGFNAVNDIWSLMSSRTAAVGSTPNDALAMALYTHTPVEFWIILWTGLAIIMMGTAIYLALIRPHV